MYLTFDCYGTLIDWRSGIVSNFKELTKAYWLNDEEVFNEYVKIEARLEKEYLPYRLILSKSFLELAEKFQIRTNMKEAEEFSMSIMNWPPFDDTVETLKILGKKGYRRYILSNVDKDLLILTINSSGMEVDGFITAEDVKSYKPNLNHWIYFFDKFNAKKEETLHVANSLYHDIKPVSKLGIRNVWVNRYKENKPEDVNPDIIVSSLSQILDFL